MYIDPSFGANLYACIVGIVPIVAILYVVYRFYIKLKNIEDHLKNIEDVSQEKVRAVSCMHITASSRPGDRNQLSIQHRNTPLDCRRAGRSRTGAHLVQLGGSPIAKAI